SHPRACSLKKFNCTISNLIQRSNSLINWSLDTAEQSLVVAKDIATPAINVFSGPIKAVDDLLCKGIDVVEEKVPGVHLPPRQMYSSAMGYAINKIKTILSLESMVESVSDGLSYLESRLDGWLPDDHNNEKNSVVPTDGLNNTMIILIQSDRCIRKLVKVLINIGMDFVISVIQTLKNPTQTLHKILDFLRKHIFPGDKRQADTPMKAFEMLLENVLLFVRRQVHDVIVKLTPLFEAYYELMIARLKIYNAVLEYFLLLAIYTGKAALWSKHSINNAVWDVEEYLNKGIVPFFETILMIMVNGPNSVKHFFGWDYEVDTDGDGMITQSVKRMVAELKYLLPLITKALVGEKYVPKPIEMRNHHQNGIEQ
ncbi:uncharacterized protein LOC144477460, partial [Augochlora pura]